MSRSRKYHGLTYPGYFVPFRWLWKRWLCPRKCHLFGEVLSIEHYLHCDCCGLVVVIERIEGGLR